MDLSVFPKGAKVGFDNGPHLTVVYWPFAKKDGSAGIQSRVRIKDGVRTIALDSVTHEVYVIQHERETLGGVILAIEFPGGGIEEGKSPLEQAKEELFEEAGVEALDAECWIQLYRDQGNTPIDGLVLTHQHAFLALSCTQTMAPTLDEVSSVNTLPLSELIAMDNRNLFNDPQPAYALRRVQDWLREHRPDLLT